MLKIDIVLLRQPSAPKITEWYCATGLFEPTSPVSRQEYWSLAGPDWRYPQLQQDLKTCPWCICGLCLWTPPATLHGRQRSQMAVFTALRIGFWRQSQLHKHQRHPAEQERPQSLRHLLNNADACLGQQSLSCTSAQKALLRAHSKLPYLPLRRSWDADSPRQ